MNKKYKSMKKHFSLHWNLWGLSADNEWPQAYKQSDDFCMFEVAFGQNTTQNSNENGINEVEDLMGLGPVVFGDLLIEGIGVNLRVLGGVFLEGVLRYGRESIHWVELIYDIKVGIRTVINTFDWIILSHN